jgi:AraC family transcriptional regulator
LQQPRVWLGIGHDAPGATPESRLRFDAALVVGGPFAPEGNIAHQLLPGGDFAITTHAGAMETLPAAYATIFERALALEGWTLIGLPAVEIYHETAIDIGRRLQHTDICLPVTGR